MVWDSGGSWCGLALEGLGFLSHDVCGNVMVWVRVVRFRSTVVGLLWGWLGEWSQSDIDRSKAFLLAEVYEYGGLIKSMF